MGLRNWLKQRKKSKADIQAIVEARAASTRRKMEVCDQALEKLKGLSLERRLNDLGPLGPERRAEAH